MFVLLALRHGVDLRELQRLGGRGDETHRLDAGARIDLLEPFAQEPREMIGIARWLRRADADCLHRIVHALEQQIELARAERRTLQPAADVAHQLVEHRRECFCRAERLDEHQAPLDDIGRRERMDALELIAERLGEPQGEHGAETLHQRRTRRRQKIADAIKPEAPQSVDHLERQAQGLHGQWCERFFQSIAGHDRICSSAIPRDRVGDARRAGNGRPCGETARA